MFAPILIIQLTYKSLWFLFVIIPLIGKGELPKEVILIIMLFALCISEQYAEATIELVLCQRQIPTMVRVHVEAVNVIAEWASDR
ncbi:MAG: hypothetical protein A2Y53_04130 [Chloroflexi bacterium RBG_16_47_49]|nr:MAG: hypothetical protein A2Y53_04130 [Chloroflexi bacterium RBG_16_47_49]